MTQHRIHNMRLLTAGALLIAASASGMLIIPRTHAPAGAYETIALLDSTGIPFDSATHSQWAEPSYKPRVYFRMAHTGNSILLHYIVRETGVTAAVTEDNGRVFSDACVEFFVSPHSDDTYYNFEVNCIGSLLLQGGRQGTRRALATADVEQRVKRYASAGTTPFTANGDTIEWQVALVIPKEAFFLDSISSFEGMTMTANFYKCGGAEPNYIMWRPIETDRPQFHRPEYFDTTYFE